MRTCDLLSVCNGRAQQNNREAACDNICLLFVICHLLFWLHVVMLFVCLLDRSLVELIGQLGEDGAQETALSLLDANTQGGLDMFQSFQSFQSDTADTFPTAPAVSAATGPWDPWTSYGCVLTNSPQPLGIASANSQQQQSRIRRSNSLTPPSNMTYPPDLWNKQVNDARTCCCLLLPSVAACNSNPSTSALRPNQSQSCSILILHSTFI